VRVTDFGVACVLAKEALDSGVASSGGTPYYMAPEQHRAMPVDARADQFSFCVALWQAVTGGHPFVAEGGDLAEGVAQGVLRAPGDPAPPRWLIQLLRRGLAVDPAARFPSMTPLLAQLDRQLARKRRRVIATAAVLAAGIAVGAFAMRGSPPPGPVCTDAGAQLDSVWTAPRRITIAAALGPAAGETLPALDRYGEDWRAARTETCRATQLGLQSGELLDLRMQCLDRRLAELEALASVLATGEAPVIEHAAAAAHSLVPLATCSDVIALREVTPLPADPVVRRRVERARVVLARVKADFDTGRFGKGYAGAQAAIPEANAIGYRPLIAETERLLGALAWRTDHGEVAEGALYRAIAAGEAGRAGYVTAEAWLELLWFVAQEQKHLQEARRLGVLAQAAVERYANNPGLTAALEERLGLIALDLHDLDGASAHLQRAYELRRATYGERDPSVAASLQHLALLAVERKDQAKAIELDRQALAILEVADGVDHPDTLLLVNTLAVALHQANRLDEALALYRRGLTSLERTGGKDSFDAAMYLHNMGMVLTTRGHHDEAIAMQRRALAIDEHVRSPDSPDLADQMYELGRTYNAAGRFTEALAALAPALPATERAYGPDSADVGLVVEEIGRALVELGRPREAIAPLQRAVTLSAHGTDDKATRRARDVLARARSLAARPRTR
jgi:tetratricopeptide (TPR) repeat protein